MRLSRIILCVLIVGFIGQILYYYPNLPEKIVSHFNSSGEPDAWMGKQNFFIIEAIVLAFILSLFLLIPWAMEKIPESMINLPNKEHWLAPERREKSFSVVRDFWEWLAVGVLALFIAINEFSFRANLTQQPLSNLVWIVLGIYLLFVGIWITKLISYFRKP